MKVVQLTATDGSKWHIPVDVIARNRAREYADEFGGSIERSLAEDTMPLFEDDDYNITDWACNNMNWEDVKHVAWKAAPAPGPDFAESWMCGDKEVIEVAGMPEVPVRPA